jgi:membrane protein required for colicin V production
VLLDLFLVSPLILYTLLGLRDGIVRKLVSIVAIILALFLGQAYMHDAAEFLVANAGISPSSAPSLGFLGIFAFVTLIVSVIYKVAADNFKIGGVADKLLGAVLGFVQGALLASSLLFIMAFQGVPSRRTIDDSRLYKPIVNLAPQIIDLGAEIGPGAVKNIEELTKPEQKKK